MAEWATLDSEPDFLTRIAADEIFAAAFVYLDWPTGAFRASSHVAEVVDRDGNTWNGVGEFASIDVDEFDDELANRVLKAGISGVFMETADAGEEADALGRNAEAYLGLFNAHWEDPVLQPVFSGFISHSGRVQYRPVEGGYFVDGSVDISDQFSPRHGITWYHHVGSGLNGDTAQRFLANVEKPVVWPAD